LSFVYGIFCLIIFHVRYYYNCIEILGSIIHLTFDITKYCTWLRAIHKRHPLLISNQTKQSIVKKLNHRNIVIYPVVHSPPCKHFPSKKVIHIINSQALFFSLFRVLRNQNVIQISIYFISVLSLGNWFNMCIALGIEHYIYLVIDLLFK